MSHGLSSVTIKDVPRIVQAAPLKLSGFVRVILLGMLLLGIGAFLLGARAEDPRPAWAAFQVNLVYWFILAAAASCFSSALHICNAQWARPIRRIFESASTFFLWAWVPLLVMWIGHHHIFSWSHEAIPGKESWLRGEFVYLRDGIAMLLLALLGRRVIFLSLRRDIGAIRSGLTGVDEDSLKRWKAPHYDKYVRNWGSDAKTEIQRATDLMGRTSPLVIMAFALIVSLIGFDQVMSVDPHWYSTLFGAFIFMSGVYLAMAWCGMGVGVVRGMHPLFRAKIERRTLHDLGKLLFGFGIFWAYLFWSHYLPIWYGNMPEETGWVITRLRLQPWHDFAWVILGSCFFVPFLLGLSRDVKQVPALLFLTGAIVAVGVWLQGYLLLVPTLYPHSIPLSLTDVLVSMGFAAAFILSAFSFLEKVPLMPFGDFYREEEH